MKVGSFSFSNRNVFGMLFILSVDSYEAAQVGVFGTALWSMPSGCLQTQMIISAVKKTNLALSLIS